jgi:hypothetical protein
MTNLKQAGAKALRQSEGSNGGQPVLNVMKCLDMTAASVMLYPFLSRERANSTAAVTGFADALSQTFVFDQMSLGNMRQTMLGISSFRVSALQGLPLPEVRVISRCTQPFIHEHDFGTNLPYRMHAYDVFTNARISCNKINVLLVVVGG